MRRAQPYRLKNEEAFHASSFAFNPIVARQIPIFSVTLLLSSLCVLAEDSLRLKYCPGVGSQVEYTIEHHRSQETSSNLSTESEKEDYSETVDLSESVVKVEPDSLVVSRSVSRVRIKGRAAGVELNYDSSKSDPLPHVRGVPLLGLTSRIGVSLEYFVDPTGRVVGVKDAPTVIGLLREELSWAPTDLSFVNESWLCLALSDTHRQVPHWACRVGAAWGAEIPLFADMGISFAVRECARVAGVEIVGGRPCVRLEETESPALDSQESGLPGGLLTIKGSQGGSTLLDAQTGVLCAQDWTSEFTLNTTYKQDETDYRVQMLMKEETSIRIRR